MKSRLLSFQEETLVFEVRKNMGILCLVGRWIGDAVFEPESGVVRN